MEPIERYREWLPAEDIIELEAVLKKPLAPALRLNTLKITPDAAKNRWLEWYGWQIEPVPFCETGWRVPHYQTPLPQTLEYKMGYYYIQDAASMLPAELFSRMDAPLVLDMAAAPGGKTTHLVSQFQDRALVVANDSSLSRIAALRSNLQTWGTIGTLITNYPGERWGQWFPEHFDKVLLDAPCSGDTLREEKGRKKRTVSSKEQEALAQRQLGLLNSAFQAVKPGGEIVYSTCTLAPEENEGVLNGLLALYPRQVSIEQVDGFPATGLVVEGYDAAVRKGVRLWPHLYQTSGFFAARIRKVDSIGMEGEMAAPRGSTKLAPLSKAQMQRITERILQEYGFDFGEVLAQHGVGLWERDRQIYAIPQRVFDIFEDLPQVGAGLLAGQLVDGEFLPAHELVTRFYEQFREKRFVINGVQAKQWLEGRDLRGMGAPYDVGTVALLEDEKGRFLGRGKILGDRIRNLLPKRVR